MEELPETPRILDDIAKSNAAKGKGASPRQQQNARRRFVIVVILFLPILGGVGFLAYQQFQLQDQLAIFQNENQQLTLAIAAQDSQIQQFQQQLEEPQQPVPVDDSSVQALESSVNRELLTLRQQFAALQSSSSVPEQEPDFGWKILEAEYFLGLANQKLQLEGDRNSAIQLLENADAALLESGNANVFATRQAISNSLTELRDIQPLDREGVYLRIGNLATRAANINLLSSMRENFESRRNAASTSLETGTNSGGIIDSALNFLGSVFVWRDWEDTPEAMLVPGQEAFIKQNLQLMLEQARLALLMRDESLYQSSLADARAWMQRYAVTDTAIGQTILVELDELAAITINPALPGLNQPLRLVRQLSAGAQ